MLIPTRVQLLQRFLAWFSQSPGPEINMKKRTPNPTNHPMPRTKLSLASKHSHPPIRNDSVHSHATMRHSDSTRAIPPQSSRTSITSVDGHETGDLGCASLEILHRDLYRQYVEDTKYLEKRRGLQHHHRALIEYEHHRHSTELESLKASFAFLDQQDELDREFEQRIRMQEENLKVLHRRLEYMTRARTALPEGVSNPLFHPDLSALR